MYKKVVLLLAVLITSAAFSLSFAQNELKVSYSVEEIINYSLENNSSLLNAKLDVLAAKKKVWETTAIGLPQVNAKIAYQNVFKVPTMSFPVTTLVSTPNVSYPGVNDYSLKFDDNKIELGVPQNTTADLTVSQLIFNGSYIVGLQASKTYKMLSEQSLEKTKEDIKELVTNSYYLCLVLEENLANLQSTIENQKKTQKEIRAMYNAGFVEESDADQVDIILNSLVQSEQAIRRQIDISYMLLKLQTGIPIEQDITLSDNLISLITSLNLQEISDVGFNPETNINYKLLLTQEQLSNLNLRNTKAEFLPSVALFYNHQEKVNSPAFDFSTPDVLGINVEIPIFSSGQRLSKVSQAGIELDKLKNSREETYNSLKIGYMKQQSDYIVAIDKFKNEEKNMKLAKSIYDKTLIKYQNGIAGSLDLAQAQGQYLGSQSNYYNAMYELLSTRTGLLKLSGKL